MSEAASVMRSRAGVRGAILALVATVLFGTADRARAEDAAVSYMRSVAKDLIAANNSGSAIAFAEALNRHAHVRAIGTYALGTHSRRLKPAESGSYFSGMVRFISRYAASESQKYQVANADFLGPAYRTKSGVMVDTRVHLKSGQSYDVQWLLQPSGGSYRVRDARVQVVLGDYWMTPFLKDLFEKYITDNGSVAALVVALNR